MAAPPLATSSFLATRRGRLVLAFLLAVAFLDFLDASIVNVALPSIARDLHFSVQNLQWVLSGYIVTYGGFLMLGGRAADLLGRRRILVAGTAVFGLASLAQPAGAFHRPGPLRPGLRPGDLLPGLVRAGPHPQLAQQLLGRADRHRGMRALMRVDPDHHCHQCTPILTSD